MILFADSEGTDQIAHPRSLIWALAVPACLKGTFSLGTAHNVFGILDAIYLHAAMKA